ncbi:MAG: hypothetical protein OEZ43_02505 [Gammaproteobacteria bacterium]|nr:hypothetical protein [Gammaproteobacteria bacterium]
MAEIKRFNPNNDKFVGSDLDQRLEMEAKLKDVNNRIESLGEDGTPLDKALLTLEKAHVLLALGKKKDIWPDGRAAFDVLVENNHWQQAAEICDVMYQSEQEEPIKALIHGIWLAVSFPVHPEVSISLLEHFVDETPPTADGAAVAAATAHYLVGLRASDEEFENLNFLSTSLLSHVARGHSQVDTQDVMDFWMEKLELKDPSIFLPRLSKVINALVPGDEWWYDRDKLREMFPQ